MWSDLSLRQRAQLIQMGVRAGIGDAVQIRKLYDSMHQYPDGGDIEEGNPNFYGKNYRMYASEQGVSPQLTEVAKILARQDMPQDWIIKQYGEEVPKELVDKDFNNAFNQAIDLYHKWYGNYTNRMDQVQQSYIIRAITQALLWNKPLMKKIDNNSVFRKSLDSGTPAYNELALFGPKWNQLADPGMSPEDVIWRANDVNGNPGYNIKEAVILGHKTQPEEQPIDIETEPYKRVRGLPFIMTANDPEERREEEETPKKAAAELPNLGTEGLFVNYGRKDNNQYDFKYALATPKVIAENKKKELDEVKQTAFLQAMYNNAHDINVAGSDNPIYNITAYGGNLFSTGSSLTDPPGGWKSLYPGINWNTDLNSIEKDDQYSINDIGEVQYPRFKDWSNGHDWNEVAPAYMQDNINDTATYGDIYDRMSQAYQQHNVNARMADRKNHPEKYIGDLHNYNNRLRHEVNLSSLGDNGVAQFFDSGIGDLVNIAGTVMKAPLEVAKSAMMPGQYIPYYGAINKEFEPFYNIVDTAVGGAFSAINPLSYIDWGSAGREGSHTKWFWQPNSKINPNDPRDDAPRVQTPATIEAAGFMALPYIAEGLGVAGKSAIHGADNLLAKTGNIAAQARVASRAMKDANVIWGHPGTGKTYLYKQGRKDIIDFDSEYKSRLGNLEEREALKEKIGKDAYNKELDALFDEAVKEARKSGKKLLVSDLHFLRDRAGDLDVITNISDEEFLQRSHQRGEHDEADMMDWKNKINEAMKNAPNKKVYNVSGYLSDVIEGRAPKTDYFNVVGIQNTQWYKDNVKKYGKEKTDQFVQILSQFDWGKNYFNGLSKKEASKQAELYNKQKTLINKITGNPDEGKALLGGSGAISAEGTINRGRAVMHDVDVNAYTKNASKDPNKSFSEVMQSGTLSPKNMAEAPIVQTLRDATGLPIPVLRVPKIFKHNRNFYRWLRGKNKLYVSPMKNHAPGIGTTGVLQGEIQGIPLDIFMHDSPLIEGGIKGIQDASQPLSWKKYWNENRITPRGKDLTDVQNYKPYSETNPIIDANGNSQWSPFRFDSEYIMQDGYPVIRDIETYPGSGEYVPSALGFDGRFHVLEGYKSYGGNLYPYGGSYIGDPRSPLNTIYRTINTPKFTDELTHRILVNNRIQKAITRARKPEDIEKKSFYDPDDWMTDEGKIRNYTLVDSEPVITGQAPAIVNTYYPGIGNAYPLTGHSEAYIPISPGISNAYGLSRPRLDELNVVHVDKHIASPSYDLFSNNCADAVNRYFGFPEKSGLLEPWTLQNNIEQRYNIEPRKESVLDKKYGRERLFVPIDRQTEYNAINQWNIDNDEETSYIDRVKAPMKNIYYGINGNVYKVPHQGGVDDKNLRFGEGNYVYMPTSYFLDAGKDGQMFKRYITEKNSYLK